MPMRSLSTIEALRFRRSDNKKHKNKNMQSNNNIHSDWEPFRVQTFTVRHLQLRKYSSLSSEIGGSSPTHTADTDATH